MTQGINRKIVEELRAMRWELHRIANSLERHFAQTDTPEIDLEALKDQFIKSRQK